MADCADRGHGRLRSGRLRLPQAAEGSGPGRPGCRRPSPAVAAGIRGHPGQSVYRRRTRLCGRGDPAVLHPRVHRYRAAPAGTQDRAIATQEAREHTPVSRVSGTNAVSDGNETNDSAPVSEVIEVSDVTVVSDETAAPGPHEAHIQVIKGQ